MEIDPFVKAYKDSLAGARTAAITAAEQERQNQQAQIMSQANRAGMMYSNLPMRTKLQYDTQTYLPNVEKIQTGYQTGLDAIRNKGVDLANQIKKYQETIADLNAQTANTNYFTTLYR